jgi:hypothetical protein
LPTTAPTALELLATAAARVLASTALATAAGEYGTAAKTGFARIANVGNNREGCLILGDGRSEKGSSAGAVYLLVW